MASRKAWSSVAATLVVAATCVASETERFAWQDEQDGRIELHWGGRPALTFVMPTLDESSKSKRQATCKPYHHVFSPNSTTLLTKAEGGALPFCRGLFFGYSDIAYGIDKSCDLWRCSGQAYQDGIGQSWTIGAGGKEQAEKGERPDDVSHCVYVGWHGQNGEEFALEQRIVGMSRDRHDAVEGWEIDVTCHVETTDGEPIVLGGDPRFSGFRFCASEGVANTDESQPYYLRTDGKGNPGECRSWDAANPESPESNQCENRAWNALCFCLENKRYTVLYLEHPSNPRPSRYIEQSCMCLGSSFEFTVTKEEPLDATYRLWVQEGEMTVDQCNAIQRAYAPDLKQEVQEDPFGIFELVPQDD